MWPEPDPHTHDNASRLELRERLWGTLVARTEEELNELSVEFYSELLRRRPSLDRYFGANGADRQARKLAAALKLLRGFAKDPQGLGQEVIRLGISHRGRGIGLADYHAFAACLADVLALNQVLMPVREARGLWMHELSAIVEAMVIVAD
ncbi:MAG: globin [Proteobacteria bacterium]|nr:globin [Pseudomonadota bacterium]